MDTNAFWPRAIIHVDMDAFFASVEVLDNPALRGKPVIVGGPAEKRGVVCAASYEARKFGVHSAMPMGRAVQLCPRGVFLPPRGWRYAEVSRAIRAIFDDFSPEVEPLSVDEAFIDVTGSQRLFGPAPEIGRQIKARIRNELHLTASVGVAPVKFVSKIASDMQKPDGFVVIREDEVLTRLAPLPVGELWGVGAVMETVLLKLGIRTVADLRAWPADDLESRFGTHGLHLHELSWGRDPRTVETESEAKSYSRETTFDRDITDPEELSAVLLELSDDVCARMRRDGVVGRVAFIKIRYDDFTTVTRRRTLDEPAALSAVLWEAGIALMLGKTEAGARPVRLVGIGMAGLQEETGTVQRDLFGDTRRREKLEAIERATDRIRDKLGDDAIGRGIHLNRPRHTRDEGD